MLKKRNRADKKAIERIFKEGRFLSSSNLTFKFIKDDNSITSRLSFIAPKSIAKLAVRRNSLRRKGYLILKKFMHRLPVGIVGVFIFKKHQDDVLILENEIKTILDEIN